MNSKLISLFSVILAVFFAGCADQPEENSAEPVLHAVTAEWTADGVVSDGEYAQKMILSGGIFEVHWKNDAEMLYMAIKGETDGWVAIGFEPEVWMKDADMIVGWVDDGEVSALDAYSTGNYGPHPPDTDLGGTDNLLEIGGSEKDGFTVIEFKRKMDTGDKFDKAFESGQTVSMIWGVSEFDDPEERHIEAGKGELAFQ
ncbi:MAG TPA: hypothetical protein HA349_11235 [Methanotrichaceae archaeon]|nr:hypothetical protein [Methanotrichaceae archaeon]